MTFHTSHLAAITLALAYVANISILQANLFLFILICKHTHTGTQLPAVGAQMTTHKLIEEGARARVCCPFNLFAESTP